MKRINLMAPTRDLDMTRYQCDAGADELYLGLDGRSIDPNFNNFTFNGRYNKMDNVECQVPDPETLKSIIDYAHSRDVEINYTGNIHYLHHDLLPGFDEYIDIGVAAGADSLIISNIGLIRHIRRRGIDLPIVAGVFLVTPNVEQTLMLADMGVNRVVLPQAITLEELRIFKEKSPLEIEIFGHFGGGNNCGRCMMLHSPTIVDIGPGCRAAYDVEFANGTTAEKSYFLDAAADCALCSLPELMEIGVDVLKIVGRESNNTFVNSKVTELYNIFQDLLIRGKSVKEIKQHLKDEELVWTSMWQERFCKRKRCRFHRTPITESYIN